MNNQNKLSKKNTFTLIIIDGFGYSEQKEHNAIAMANTPTWDSAWEKYPRTLINCSGNDVGLPADQMGNSEVGHMNIGAGRVIYQDLTRIDNDIQTGEFLNNPTLINYFEQSSPEQCFHVIGLISEGGVHSHLRHYLALAELAKQQGCSKLYVHAFLDGRDTPPKSALDSLNTLNNFLVDNKIGQIVSVVGRYYAMDRDKRWERTQLAYDMLTNDLENRVADTDYFIAKDLATAVQNGYGRGETDEFIKPTIIANSLNEFHQFKIKDHDNVLFLNFRSDRARQLSSYLVDTDRINLNQFVTFTEYNPTITENVVYRPTNLSNTLGEIAQNNDLKQLRIAETEKYAHVTFFFNGGREEPFKNEDRVLIPSPKVATYDLKPEMSAPELTDKLCAAIESGTYDLIICNYANPDMVGHTGSLDATIKAIETIDQCLGQVIHSNNEVAGHIFITADHGNAERMFDDKTQQPHTAHTHSVVPLLYITEQNTHNDLIISKNGVLADLAPSMLHLMGLAQPTEMTGKVLFKLNERSTDN